MPVPSTTVAARAGASQLDAGGRVVPFVVVAGTLLLIAVGARLELHPAALVAIAAVPLVLVVGHRVAIPLLVVAFVVRALVDDLDNLIATAGVAVVITLLAGLVLVRSRGWPVPVGLILGVVLVSALAGTPTFGAEETLGEAARVASCVGVVVIAANAPGRMTTRRVAHIIQVVGIVPAVVTVVELAGDTGRGAGTLAHPNSAALLFALCNIATFALIIDSARRRWLHVLLLLLFLAAQVATGSIGGLATVMVMAVVYLLTSAVRRADRIVLGVVGLGLAAYAAVTSSVGAERLSEYTGPGTEETSFEWRVLAWEQVLDAWRRHPVFGNGIGSTYSDAILRGNIPHNEYVRLLAEIGVVGLLAVIVGALWYAHRMHQLMKAGHAPKACALALAILAGLAVNALAANTALYTVAFYLALFTLAACWRIAQDSVRAEPSAAGPNGRRIEAQRQPAGTPG